MIDIVTVTHNSSEYIRRFLIALKRNKKVINSLILIDNNSKDWDRLKKKVDTFKKENKYSYNIVLIRNYSNVGYGIASNQGAKFAKSRSILFLNPDSIPIGTSIITMYSHLRRSGADIIGGTTMDEKYESLFSGVRYPNVKIGLLHFTNLGKLLKLNHRNFFYYPARPYKKTDKEIKVNAVSGAAMLINKTMFNKLSGFDEHFFMYLEDVDLCLRANTLNGKIYICPHSRFVHNAGSSSADTKTRTNQKAWFRSRKYYYKKHFNFFVNILIQPLMLVDELVTKIVNTT